MTWVWDQAIAPNQKIVLLAIADHANDEGGNSFPSQETLAKKTGYTVRQVRRIIGQLSDLGMLQVGRAKRPGKRADRQPNLYKVLMGKPSTGGHPCPPVPACPPVHGRTPMSSEPSVIITSTNGNRLLRSTGRCAPRPGGSVILGVDPDEMVAVVQSPRVAKPQASALPMLVSHFVQHPAIVMTRRYDQKDIMILRRSIKGLLSAGVTRTAVVNMIDKFYATDRFKSAERPVLVFSMKSVQQELLAFTNGRVDAGNPVLSLMLHDFVREDGVDVPWSAQYDADLQASVIRHGLEVCYRYPELVAELALLYPGDFKNKQFIQTLTTLNDFILSVNSDSTESHSLVTQLSTILSLPKELHRPSSKTIRKDSNTLAEAIFTYRRTVHA